MSSWATANRTCCTDTENKFRCFIVCFEAVRFNSAIFGIDVLGSVLLYTWNLSVRHRQGKEEVIRNSRNIAHGKIRWRYQLILFMRMTTIRDTSNTMCDCAWTLVRANGTANQLILAAPTAFQFHKLPTQHTFYIQINFILSAQYNRLSSSVTASFRLLLGRHSNCVHKHTHTHTRLTVQANKCIRVHLLLFLINIQKLSSSELDINFYFALRNNTIGCWWNGKKTLFAHRLRFLWSRKFMAISGQEAYFDVESRILYFEGISMDILSK